MGLDLCITSCLSIFITHICEDTSNELVGQTMTWEVVLVMWNLSFGANTALDTVVVGILPLR